MSKFSKNGAPQDNKDISSFFIAGCGRSGTTYVRTVIDAHPDIYIPTESLFIADYLIHAKYVPQAILSWLFFNEPQLKSWYSGTKFNIVNIRDAILKVHRHAVKINGAKIWGQKTPRFIRYIDLFNRNFNGIKWILIYRDPRAVAASMLKSKRHTFSISRACKRWTRDNRPIIELLQSSKKHKNILIIQYEHFVRNFDSLLEKIFLYLGVTPIGKNEVVLRGSTPKLKGSKFQIITVRDGLEPHEKLIDTWKNTLTPKQILQIETACSHEMKILGYSPSSNLAEFKENILDKYYREYIKDFLILLEYLHKWPHYLFHTAMRKAVFAVCYMLHKIREKYESI